MKGYKGYSKGLICRDKQYAENTVFEEDSAEICKSGMHFCDLPHAVFEHYPPGNSEYTEVEALADCVTDDNCKYSTTKLAVGAKVDVFDLVKISVNAFFEKHNFAKRISEVKQKKGAANAGDCGAANAGYRGAANAGYRGAANAGHYGAANAGHYGAANAGDFGAANAGYRGAANAGDYGAANAGDFGAANAGHYGAANAGHYGAANAGHYGAANAGYRGAANAGDYGAAHAGNYGAAIAREGGGASVGKGGVAVAFAGKAKGKLGALLVLCAVEDDRITDHVAVVVDGEKIKADTYYVLNDGKVGEWDENEEG